MRYTIAFTLASLVAGAAAAEVPRVVTDIHPVHSLTAQVMGDLGTPELLLEKGADEHAFQLRPSQAASLAEADLVIWIGPELTPWLDRALDGVTGEVSRLGLLAADATYRQDFGLTDGHDHAAEEVGHDHAAEEAGHDHAAEEAGHDHAGDEHDHSGLDPHVWLDPANAKLWLTLIAADLSRLDPANAATYAANAASAKARIEALDAEVAALLDPVKGKPIVVFHDAYGYFAGHYGLTVAASVALGDAASPGAARLSALRSTIKAGTALCIFPEVQHDPALVTQMAEGTGIRIGGAIDPSGSSLEPGPGLYPGLLTGLARTIAACLEG